MPGVLAQAVRRPVVVPPKAPPPPAPAPEQLPRTGADPLVPVLGLALLGVAFVVRRRTA
jgi:LPXTG-motif cell wall-anchored protein